MPNLSRVRTTFCHPMDEEVSVKLVSCCPVLQKKKDCARMESRKCPQRIKITATGAQSGIKSTDGCFTHPHPWFDSRHPKASQGSEQLQ